MLSYFSLKSKYSVEFNNIFIKQRHSLVGTKPLPVESYTEMEKKN